MRLCLIVLTILNFSSVTFAEDCSDLIGSCDYYLCREEIQLCGTKGYFLGFGYRYCKRSEDELSPKMSTQGQKWISDVATCLQRSTDKIPYDDNCTDTFKTSISNHQSCYEEAHFCDLTKKDQLNIIKMVSRELRRPEILRQGVRILLNCRNSSQNF